MHISHEIFNHLKVIEGHLYVENLLTSLKTRLKFLWTTFLSLFNIFVRAVKDCDLISCSILMKQFDK